MEDCIWQKILIQTTNMCVFVCVYVFFLLKTIRERGSYKHSNLQYNVHCTVKKNPWEMKRKKSPEETSTLARKQHWNDFISGYTFFCNNPISCAISCCPNSSVWITMCSVANLSWKKNQPLFHRIFCVVAYLFVVALTVLLTLQIHTYLVHVNCNVFAAYLREHSPLLMDLSPMYVWMVDIGRGRWETSRMQKKKMSNITVDTEKSIYFATFFNITKHHIILKTE